MVTIFVSKMDDSIKFYTQKLGLNLITRFENEFAMLQGPGGLKIGLHPASAQSPAGKISIGIQVSEAINNVVSAMKSKGIQFRSDVVDDGEVRVANFSDPDGAELYLVEAQPEYKQYV
jgi:catechol 2,3-dioxygenase-like lactoylglutathione lyase family enzyme